MDEGLVLCRLVHFAASFIAFGCGAFRLYGLAPDPAAESTSVLSAFDAQFGRVVVASALAVLLSGIALLLFVSATMAGSAAAALDPATVAAVLCETTFGKAWRWHLVFAVLLLATWGLRPSRRRPAMLGLSLLVVVSLGWVGHAAAGEGPLWIGHELNQMVHLTAAALWLGGLAPLGWLLWRVRRLDGSAWRDVARGTLVRFSQVGYVAVALIALTGAANTALLVGGVGGLLATPYGRLLLLKILLFLAMTALALINRYRLLPRLQLTTAPFAGLARSVVAEQLLGLAILAVVSVLGTWPPAAHGGAM